MVTTGDPTFYLFQNTKKWGSNIFLPKVAWPASLGSIALQSHVETETLVETALGHMSKQNILEYTKEVSDM